MATAASDVFTEHLGVIAALRDNYQRQDDQAAVAGLVLAQQEAAASCSEREDAVKAAIKGAPPAPACHRRRRCAVALHRAWPQGRIHATPPCLPRHRAQS